MRTRTKLFLACGSMALIVLSVLLVAYHDGVRRSLFLAYTNLVESDSAQDSVWRIYVAVEPGMPMTSVREAYDGAHGRWRGLEYAEDAQLGLARIMTPLRWDAKNWCLFIQHSDDRVVAVAVRYHDSSHWSPKAAPPDKIAPGIVLDENLVVRYHN